MVATPVDDRPTLAALGMLAFALENVSHEALGHGLATLAVGNTAVLLTTCYFDSSGHGSKWVSAAGGLMNLAVGVGALGAFYLSSRLSAHLRYFLVLVAAFNLFNAFGYPAYSAIAQFGDWTAVISGLEPRWIWRVLLVIVAVAGYYGSMRLLARAIAPFAGTVGAPTVEPVDKARLRRMTLTPFIASMVLACLAGALNPKGLSTMLTSGLPAAAAAFGLTQLHHYVSPEWRRSPKKIIAPLPRSLPWIMTAAGVAILFIGMLGPGIRFH